ncbi:MAG: hypothetical protein PVJ57_11945 [Phycisphaerae bacterium]|jgi:hypothetical protein
MSAGKSSTGFLLVLAGGMLALAGGTMASAQEAIIIDHNCTDLSAVPLYWIERAKLLTIHYGHTSHGSQIISGFQVLEGVDPTYSIAVRASGTEGLPPEENPPALRMYDGNPPETYVQPDDYWYGQEAQDRTRAVADTGHYNFSMWSWCGQQSGATEAYTQAYLDAMLQFESEYPAMRFILMTGHTDGSGEEGNLNARNNQVRDFCIAHNMVLFDFADLESYNPDGEYFLDRYCNDNCDYQGGNWATEWCGAHPGSDLCISCSCAHSQSLNCNVKGRAFWWMMARLAGWHPVPQAIGDVNCDDAINNFDIAPFVQAVTNPDGYAADHPDCDLSLADINGDGALDNFDIGPFVELIVGK